MVVCASYGQGIQTGAFFRDDDVAAFVVCGVTAFYTHRAAHGRTAQERSAYAIGLKAGEQTPTAAILPTDAELNMLAQKYFKQQGSGGQFRILHEQLSCRLGISRSKTVIRTGSRRHTAVEQNIAGRSLLGAFALSTLGDAFSAFRFNHKGF